MAVELANEDIANFGTEDRYWFLDNTWSLLPETNTSLRQQFLYTIFDYQLAVFKMHAFFHFLGPKVIFASFRGVPDKEEIDKLTTQAKLDLKMGKKYVGAKLLSASVLAAGGDAPMCLFMGDVPSRHHNSEKLEDSLPIPSAKNLELGHCDMDVFSLLSGGRRSESSFDTKQSPLAAYLYAELGDENLQILLKNKTLSPMDDNNAKNILECLPQKSINFLAKTMASIAVSRSKAILNLLDELPKRENWFLEEQHTD